MKELMTYLLLIYYCYLVMYVDILDRFISLDVVVRHQRSVGFTSEAAHWHMAQKIAFNDLE